MTSRIHYAMVNDALWAEMRAKMHTKRKMTMLQVEDNRRRRLDPFNFFLHKRHKRLYKYYKCYSYTVCLLS